MPGSASLFSLPLKGPGEAFHAENVGTYGSFVRSNTLIKPSIFHSCCIKRSGRTSRASLHTGARKLVLPSFERSGGGFPCGECGDAWPIRPLKHAHETKLFHSCCIERSGRTSRASLHTGARKPVLPSFGGVGGGFQCGECRDARLVRPLKYGASKYINKRISKQVVGGCTQPVCPYACYISHIAC